MSSDNMAALKEEADQVSDAVLLRYIRVMSTLSDKLRFATQKRVLTEVAVIRLCKPEMEKDYSSLVDRIERIEGDIESGAVAAKAPAGGPAGIAAGTVPAAAPAPAHRKHVLPDAAPEDIEKLVNNWNQAVNLLSGVLKSSLKLGIPTLDEKNELLIVFYPDQQVAYDQLVQPENTAKLKAALEGAVGKSLPVHLKLLDGGRKKTDEFEDLIQKFGQVHGIDIAVEDFGDEDV